VARVMPPRVEEDEAVVTEESAEVGDVPVGQSDVDTETEE